MSVEAADASAREIFRDPDQATPYEPVTFAEAKAAVLAFGDAYESAAKTLRKAAERSRVGASSLSDDPLQGLSEVIQNADDQGATYVQIEHSGNAITFVHDGRLAHLKNIHAISLPWLTTNEDVAETTGRFGIGLSTLQSLSDHFDFMSGPYRVRIGDPYLSWVDADPRETAPSEVTTLRVPLGVADVSVSDFEKWVKTWSHQGLIFLRSVRRITFEGGTEPTELSIDPQPVTRARQDPSITITHVSDPDGNAWNVYRRTVPTPDGMLRKAKKTADTTSVDLAFPIGDHVIGGHVYAGLSVERFPYSLLINAPLDPTTSRRGFLSNSWNESLIEIIADAWDVAMQDLFLADTPSAWAHVPVTKQEGLGLSPCTNSLAELLYERGISLPERLTLRIDGADVPLTDAIVEVPELTGIIDAPAVDQITDGVWLPTGLRDTGDRWFRVWEHWVDEDQPVFVLLTTNEVIPLLESPQRPDEWIIRLHAAVIENATPGRSVGSRCLITATDGRQVMPDADAVVAFSMDDSTGLGHSLGVSTNLSVLYGQTPAGEVVLGHLRELSRLLDEHSPEALLQHLARLGESGISEPIEVTDDQLRQIREAVEVLGRKFFSEIGVGLGNAIALDCFNSSGSERESHRMRPSDAYLGRPYVTEVRSWAVAATVDVGWWIDPRYETVLQSDLPRERAMGPRRFLSGLGASVYGRLEPITGHDKTYSSQAGGGTSLYGGRPNARRLAVSSLNADYTLDDLSSPDLCDAARSIADEPEPVLRRRRATALLDSVRAGWRNIYEDDSRVKAVRASHGWHMRGEVRALWLWELGSIAWMDDSNGEPRAPLDLKLRTPSNIALHGEEPSSLIHPDLEAADSQTLRELGVAGEPNPPELLDALAALRDADQDPTRTFNNCLAIYAALGDWVTSPDATLGERQQVRREFAAEMLIYTGTAWVTAKQAFRGEPIFRSYRPFAPPGPTAIEDLWRWVQVQQPNALDCANVLSDISKNGPLRAEDVPVVVEILRYLEGPSAPEVTPHGAKRWKSVPVWVGDKWTTRRPVFATDNPLVADALSAHVPLWQPQAHTGQFSVALQLMGLTPIDETAVEVDAVATFAPEITDAFQATIQALHDDLVLNDDAMLESLTLPWDELTQVTVHVCEQIDARVNLGTRELRTSVRAWLDRPTRRLLVQQATTIEDSSDIASAVAAWFSTSSRHAEDAWYRAVRAVLSSTAQVMQVQTSSEIAAKQRRTNAAEASKALAGLQKSIGIPNKKKAKKKQTETAALPGTSADNAETSGATPPPRNLIDPDDWVFQNSEGHMIAGKSPAPARPAKTAPMRDPKRPKPPKPPHDALTTHRSYTDKQKELVGLELVRRIIESDDNRVHDLRDQYSVGADAMDDMQRFFELKVSGGSELDTITLEPSQVERALSTPNFFLVVVSGVEQGAENVKVRFIHRPTDTLTITERTKLEFSGVRSASSMLFTATELSEEVADA